jgi:hypothetical protein
LIGDLIEDPQLLARLASNDGLTNGTGEDKSAGWENEEKLAEAVSLGGAYSLAGTDLRPLLIIMPDAFSGSFVDVPAGPTWSRSKLFPVDLGRGISANLESSSTFPLTN